MTATGRPAGLDEAAVRAALGDAVVAFEEATPGEPCADVTPASWPAAHAAARDALGLDVLDWLTAVDELDDGFAVVAHLTRWQPGPLPRLLLRTRVPREDPRLGSVVGVHPGAAWHERETHEMLGVVFDGHPGLRPLLLPEGFEERPLRKDFLLPARQERAWPGAADPSDRVVGEGARPSRRRRPLLPPGVAGPGRGERR